MNSWAENLDSGYFQSKHIVFFTVVNFSEQKFAAPVKAHAIYETEKCLQLFYCLNSFRMQTNIYFFQLLYVHVTS